MASKQVEIPGIGNVSLVKRRGSRNIRLSFSSNGSIRVSLPYYAPYQTGIDFVRSKQDWIAKHRPTTSQELQNGDRIGKAHRLSIIQTEQAVSPRVLLKQNTITISCPVNMSASHQSVQNSAIRGARKALKKEADQLLPQRLSQLALKHGFTYTSVNTKRLTARWGSCNQFNDIVLNIYLMQLPWHLIDYVIVHELVHTEHLNHSADFWRRFEHAMPGAKQLRRELKNYKTEVVAV